MKVGDYVIASYKSGDYVGELLTFNHPKSKVRVVAVVKHPMQGDLHHPQQIDVAMFHQRRALSYREVANIPVSDIVVYEQSTVPEYNTSLHNALNTEIEAMQKLNTPFGNKAAEELLRLKQEYWTSGTII
jgi:kinase-associated protein B